MIAHFLIAMAAATATPPTATVPDNFSSAIEYCDTTSLHHIEGIWQFTEDGVKVMIASNGRKYDIIVLSTEDGSLIPGEKLGEAIPTAGNRKYELHLFTSRTPSGKLKADKKCIGTLTADGTEMTVKRGKSAKLQINPLAILPRFWRIVKITAAEDINDNLQHGLIKIYPSIDGNGSSPHNPRYL